MRFVDWKTHLTISLGAAAIITATKSGSRSDHDNLYVYPERMGNFTLGSCGDAPSCGSTMTTFNGIPAKSNGQYQCTGNSCGSYGTYGSQYQCVELAQRYFGELYGTTPIWYGNAIDLCDTKPSGVSITSNPVPGDLVVFNTGTYGHVAVITSISNGYLNVMEQNSSPNGINSYSMSSSIKCYLHADNNSGSYCANGGWYCGNDGLNKDPNTNYYCDTAGGSVTKEEKCSSTCVTEPKGYNDECTSEGDCTGLHGYYCGGDKIQGDANTLFLCLNGANSGATYCSSGCHVANSGYDDYCN